MSTKIKANIYCQVYSNKMKLTLKRYALMLFVQTILFIIDFLINTLSVLVKHHKGISLILFIIQSTCLILSLCILLLTFFSTYAFQAGLIDLLYEKFHLSLVIFISYFILTVIFQIWFLVDQWNSLPTHIWPTPLYILYIFQRTLTPIYYYYYKRASLRISDPRFYEDVWNDSNIETAN